MPSNAGSSTLNAARFDALCAQQDSFEAALGEASGWDAMEGCKAVGIVIASEFTDLSDKHTWPEMVNWLIQRQIAMREALAAGGGDRLASAVRSSAMVSCR